MMCTVKHSDGECNWNDCTCPQQQSGWRERFDEKFATDRIDGNIHTMDGRLLCFGSLHSVKAFIASVESEAEARGRDEAMSKSQAGTCGKTIDKIAMCGVKLDCHLHDWRADLDRKRGRLEGLQEAIDAVPPKFVPPIKFDVDYTEKAYNLCREETLANIRKLMDDHE